MWCCADDGMLCVLCCVWSTLCCRLYEEVEPARILDERAAASGSGKEFLVQYKVGASWGMSLTTTLSCCQARTYMMCDPAVCTGSS